MNNEIFSLCQSLFPEWKPLKETDFHFDPPKGFSSFTMGIRSIKNVNPPAVLFRKLEGKENAILDFEIEKDVFLLLSDHDIAAKCHYYDEYCRIEEFYKGRTLEPVDLCNPEHLRRIGHQLSRIHQIKPQGIPPDHFFELVHKKWGLIARDILNNRIDEFPLNEQEMCIELREIYEDRTLEMVLSILPEGPLCFCHNDTYHGNIMKLENHEIKLLDFEFSCLNHPAYDFSNLFAETVMTHKLRDYPYFRIEKPEYSEEEIKILIDAYLDKESFSSKEERKLKLNTLLNEVKQMIPLSDFKYAMAAITLSVNPIQKIRFIPYAYQRFKKFKDALS